MSDGCLTREQFNNAIDMFAEKCQILNENWCVRHVEVYIHGCIIIYNACQTLVNEYFIYQ